MKKTQRIYHKIYLSFRMKLLLCLFLSVIIIGLFYIKNKIIDIELSHRYNIINNYKLVNQIEQVALDENILSISGYALLLDMSSDDTTISLLLKGVTDDKETWANVEHVSRYDVDSYFTSRLNHINSGFNAMVKNVELNTDECYEIIIKLSYGKTLSTTVSTNRYILNGVLLNYNPDEFDMPDLNIESDLLREIITNGNLCLYHKDSGIYIYQYENKLYWIAHEDFKFSENGFFLPFHLYTSQIDMLPEERMQYGFDNKDFYFETYEVDDENTTPYRVAVRNITNEYPIAYLTTGLYDNTNKKLLWSQHFHINHDFD